MKIINTFDKIQYCYKDNKFDLNSWRKYAKEISSELSEKCEQDSKGYNFETDVFPVVNNVLSNREAFQANASFISVTEKLGANLNALFDRDFELNIILYLGLCNGAGWATTLDGKDAVLLGIEKIIELKWQNERDMQALLFHEIGHIWHKNYGVLSPKTESQGEEDLLQLWQEGIAMFCEQILCRDKNFYHQDKNGWLAWCKANDFEIKRDFLNRIENNLSAQDFFGDWCEYKGNSDVGYYLGCEFVKYLAESYSLTEIANLNLSNLYAYFKAFAQD